MKFKLDLEVLDPRYSDLSYLPFRFRSRELLVKLKLDLEVLDPRELNVNIGYFGIIALMISEKQHLVKELAG